MRHKQKCDVCETDKDIAGVCCSGIGAISFSYCTICLAMGAEPKYAIIDDEYIKETTVYFEDDQYKINGKLHPIKTNDGREFNTRTEYFNREKV